MITPPSVGPRIGAIIIGTATMLITRPMRFGPAAWAIISCAIGMIIPPPRPWRTRNRTSSVVDVARPQSADPSVNRITDTR
jgi:hypothetical protein